MERITIDPRRNAAFSKWMARMHGERLSLPWPGHRRARRQTDLSMFTRGMIAKEGLPAWRRWPPSPGHVFCNYGLADVDAELESQREW
jgi:hypothetical protein